MPTHSDPFTSVIPEVPLKAAPLVRVVAQLKFPIVASFARLDAVGPFQEAIRNDYPILRPEQMQVLVLGPQGAAAQPAGATLWRFHDKQDQWRVSLATDFVALETTAYPGRDQFLNRLKAVLVTLHASAKLAVYDRLGIRYVNRVTGTALKDLPKLVRPEVLGILGTEFGATLVHSLSESTFAPAHGHLNVRWGLLPAMATPDPTTVQPVNEPSWLLDMDMFMATQQEFDLDEVLAKARSFTSSIYAFFRWSVEDEFLRRFGGNP